MSEWTGWRRKGRGGRAHEAVKAREQRPLCFTHLKAEVKVNELVVDDVRAPDVAVDHVALSQGPYFPQCLLLCACLGDLGKLEDEDPSVALLIVVVLIVRRVEPVNDAPEPALDADALQASCSLHRVLEGENFEDAAVAGIASPCAQHLEAFGHRVSGRLQHVLLKKCKDFAHVHALVQFSRGGGRLGIQKAA